MPPKPTPSRQTLDEVPARAIKFLLALGEVIPIRTAMAARGDTEQEHTQGWDYLNKLGGFRIDSTPTLDEAVRNAIAELDRWDNDHFPVIENALDRLFPEQCQFVFDNLEPKEGVESVVAVLTLLNRLDALENW